LRIIERVLILFAALAFDRLGEPPTKWHPVGWLGATVAWLTQRSPERPALQLPYGTIIVFVPTLIAALASGLIDVLIARLDWRARIFLRGLALSWTFSLRGLDTAAQAVANDLHSGSIDDARTSVRSLVSRPSDGLRPSELAAAAIESVAENASDSVVAPLFWWSIAGPAGAGAYRAINTADAMVGYHGRYEHLGRVPARLDDLVNLIPARLTGVAVCISSGELRSLRMMMKDHGRTESPNAGWPMSAMAGALNRRLSKPGHYVLASESPQPTADDILRAIRVMRRAVALTLAPLSLLSGRPR
jgi:adenosylcobinamide-phosphate synthase